MIVTYHFNADYKPFKDNYGFPIKKLVFEAILTNDKFPMVSRIFVGDLVMWYFNLNLEEIYDRIILLRNVVWGKFLNEKIAKARQCNIFVVAFDNIDLETAELLHASLMKHPSYIGAWEINERLEKKYEDLSELYNTSLMPYARIDGKNLYLFYKIQDDKDYAHKQEFEKLGFDKVEFEKLN
jgi:hypothetical protein